MYSFLFITFGPSTLKSNEMKRLSLLSLVSAALCVFWACEPVDIDDPENGKNNDGNNKPDSTQVSTIDWNDPDWYSVNFWDRTDRQKAGFRGPVKKWHINNYTTYDEYEYDQAGHLIREAYVNTGDQESNHEWRYTYDADGHRIKAELYYAYEPDSVAAYWEYEYRNTGKYVAREWFMMGPEISGAEDGIWKDLSRAAYVIIQPFDTTYREYTYTFGGDSLTIRESSYNVYLGDVERSNEETYEYSFKYQNGYPVSLHTNRLRFQVEGITYYPNGMYKDFEYLEENAYNFDTGWDRFSYTMLDNPRYLAVDTFNLGGTASYMSLTPKLMKKTYDSHFDISVNQEWYSDTVAVPTFTDTFENYTYDKYGNWVTRDETIIARWTGQVSTSTITREMEYFE